MRPQKEKGFATFLIALLISALFFIPYMIINGGYFVFYGDFNAQQIPFYQLCHKAIREGNFFWNNNTDLGVNFIGSYAFYLLGSPFFWLTLPFPNEVVPMLMGPLFILKFACAALTAYFYIRRFTRTPQAAQLGGLLYAFSGFSIYNIFFNHFHEAIIVFPLLLLSLEMLITENRRFVFAFMVCLCAITNYFFFFGMVVFTVIYFFVRLFSGAVKVRLSRFLVIAFEAVLGLTLSAALLLPSIFAIIENSRISSTLIGWNAIMYGKEQIYANVLQCFFFPPDLPARPVFFPKAEVKWSSLGGWLPLFSMVGVFTFFSQRRGHWLKRVIGICIFMAMVPFLNSTFYAFNTSYYARWFYMPILMMCLATVSLCEDNSVNWKFGFGWVLGITLATTAVVGLFPQKNSDGKTIFGLYSQGGSDDDRLMYMGRFWVTAAIAVISLLILWLTLKLIKKNKKAFYRTATICVCIISVLYANFFVACGRSHSYSIQENVIDGLIKQKIDLEDESEFRIDVYDGMDNTAMYLGYPSINAFHSIVPASVFEFYEYLGVERSVASRPEIELEALRPLLSVKYLVNPKYGDSFINEETNETKVSGYKYLKTDGDFYIYENENYIPYGFSYEYYMTEDFCDSYIEEERAALMLKAVKLTDKQIKKYGDLMTNIETAGLSYYEDTESSLSTSYSAMEIDSKKLAETSAENFNFDNRGFTARVKREKANLVFFSIPYDKGWSATVNGKPVEVEKVNSGFMAVKVEAGTSDIRFNYMTPKLIEGLWVTLVGTGVFLLYILIYLIYSRNRQDRTVYPEGEALIKKWRKEELDEIVMSAEEKEEKRSLLDSASNIEIPKINNGFVGGFRVDTTAYDQEDN